MRERIIAIIEQDFGNQLTIHKYNQYVPKLRDYFVPYLLEQNEFGKDIPEIFGKAFNRNCIIQSAVYYIQKNENVSSKSAIDDFLIALNQLFEHVLFIKYPNEAVERLTPFATLAVEVEDKLKHLGVALKEREAYPPIEQSQFKYLINHLEALNTNNFKAMSIRIVVKLLLLYGLNVDRISSMQIQDYDAARRVLKVHYRDFTDRVIQLELPFSLVVDLEVYMRLREEQNFQGLDLLFLKVSGKPVRHDLAHEFLSDVKIAYEKEFGEKIAGKNPFTLTGLQKYAIINMILEGMNQSVIIALTGLKEHVINDCQREVDKQSALNRNRYINYKIRGTKTFEMLSQ